MRKLIFTFSLAFMTIAASAIPALRGQWKTVKLADGREIRVELRGDEFMSYWQAADGTKYINNEESGFYELADMDKLIANAEPKRVQVSQDRAKKAPMQKTVGVQGSGYYGEKRGIIILVQFADLSFEADHTQELFNDIANGENYTSDLGFVGSVRDYFRDQSYGQFILDFDVVGPVTMPNGYAYYGGKDENGNNDNYKHIAEMIMDACQAVDDQVDFSQYDWDGDGTVDQVFILYAGQGQAANGGEDTIWPHEYNIISASGGQTITLDGVSLYTYACSNELSSDMKLDGIGTICHEFSHCLGLPDMYDTEGSNYGMGAWDLLDYGGYNGDGFVPAGYTSYEKWYSGWLDLTELEDDQQVSNMKSLNDNAEAYIIYNDGHKDEYYLLENRTSTGWDAGLGGSGLLVLHVDYSSTYWISNKVNAGSTQHMTIIPANNSLTRNDESGHPYPYKGINSLTNTTTPATELNNKNTDGTKYMNKSLTNITKNSDSTISFTFENNNRNNSDYVLPDTYFFYESFDLCDGSGGNDKLFTGSNVGKGTFKGYTDNDGWTSTSGHGAYKCAMFGSSTTQGAVTTPEITFDGECILWFKAAPYTGDGNNLSISVASGDVSLSKAQFVMTEGTWSAYSTTITGSGSFKLKFQSETKRFFLDEVCFTYENTSGINNIETDSQNIQDGRIYSIDGRYMGNDLNALKSGLYIVNGKKIIK